MIQSLFPSYPINHCIRATNVHHRPPLTHTWEINTWSRNQLPHPGNVEARPRRRAISVWFLIKETTTVSPGPNHIPIPKLIHCACPGLSPTNLFQAAPDPSCLRSRLPAMARAGDQGSKLFSFFLQALRSFLFWAGCQSSRPPSPSPLRDTLAVPSSLSRWSSKML